MPGVPPPRLWRRGGALIKGMTTAFLGAWEARRHAVRRSVQPDAYNRRRHLTDPGGVGLCHRPDVGKGRTPRPAVAATGKMDFDKRLPGCEPRLHRVRPRAIADCLGLGVLR